jgi:hypothetical protein
MPRGGFRPGSGRRPKNGSAPKPAVPHAAAKAAAERMEGADSPLEYLRAVMLDPHADPARRDRAAQCLLPYTHARAAGTPSSYNYVPKKDEAQKRARWAGFGGPWWKLLHSDEEREEREAELAGDPELRRWVEAEMHRTDEADRARRPEPEPEVKSKAKPVDRWTEYLGHDEATDWIDPATGKSDLEFNPRGYRYPPDDE